MKQQNIYDVFRSNYNYLKVFGFLHVTIRHDGYKTTLKDYISFIVSVQLFSIIAYLNLDQKNLMEISVSQITAVGLTVVQSMNYFISLIIIFVNFFNRNKFAEIMKHLNLVDLKVSRFF